MILNKEKQLNNINKLSNTVVHEKKSDNKKKIVVNWSKFIYYGSSITFLSYVLIKKDNINFKASISISLPAQLMVN